MQKFTTLTSTVISLPRDDVDTDQIIPAQYLKVTDKDGLAKGLFAGWRYLPSGEDDTQFPLNQKQSQTSEILLVGNNFGCGSSREHAVWALSQWGIRAVIASSFADIFRNNALKNGLLPVQVSEEFSMELVEAVQHDPVRPVKIDLNAQVVHLSEGEKTEFLIDAFSKKCLIEGLDPLGYLMKNQDRIQAYENKRRGETTWWYSTKEPAVSQ